MEEKEEKGRPQIGLKKRAEPRRASHCKLNSRARAGASGNNEKKGKSEREEKVK